MIRQIAVTFLALVLIMLVVKHPHAVIGVLQMFVDAAETLAGAIAKTIKANGGKQ